MTFFPIIFAIMQQLHPHHTKNESEDWWQGIHCLLLHAVADSLEIGAFDCFLQTESEEFSLQRRRLSSLSWGVDLSTA